MFDTMTMTKIVGSVCGALLVFLFGNWAAQTIYGLGEAGHGEEHTYAYEIAVDSAEAAPADTGEAEPAYADLIASADIAAGEKVFGKCKSCHKIDGGDGTGPHMNGVVGRARGSVAGFKYSEAMASVQDPWTGDTLYAFLKNPKEYVPGTKMGFAGLAKPEDRVNVIAYLESLK